MRIEEICPNAVTQTSTLRDQLLVRASESALSRECAVTLIELLPQSIVTGNAFLDQFTGLWRYEFGDPYTIADSQCWGTHMWPQVKHLFAALYCAHTRLSDEKIAPYLRRLADRAKHMDVLAEMIPAHKVGTSVPLEFEASGYGKGMATIDWIIGPPEGRRVLLEVKRRCYDFIEQGNKIIADSHDQIPTHDPSKLFSSIEKKFEPANSSTQLQGAWICTEIKQNEKEFRRAFEALCPDRVHFAILGDWGTDAYVITRVPEDSEYLKSLFGITNSERFIFHADDII